MNEISFQNIRCLIRKPKDFNPEKRYPENAHDAWSDTYSNPAVFIWLLQHKNQNSNKFSDKYNNSEVYG